MAAQSIPLSSCIVMSSDSSAGSYDFAALGVESGELERLQLQARRSAELELQLLRRMGLKDGLDVLDLACGPGVITRLIAESHPSSRVTAMDLNEALLEQAKTEAAAVGLNTIHFVRGDVYQPPLPAASFDFIYARLLFQHLDQPIRALDQVRRLLKPGGRLCIMDIDDDWLTLVPEPKGFRAFTQAAGRAQAALGGNRRIGRELGRLMEQSGFVNVHLNVETISSRQLGMRAFLEITLGFKRLLLQGDELEAALTTLAQADALIDTPDAWALVGVFLATGEVSSDASDR